MSFATGRQPTEEGPAQDRTWGQTDGGEERGRMEGRKEFSLEEKQEGGFLEPPKSTQPI